MTCYFKTSLAVIDSQSLNSLVDIWKHFDIGLFQNWQLKANWGKYSLYIHFGVNGYLYYLSVQNKRWAWVSQ